MKKSQLRQLVKEAMGYSKYAPGGTTKGGTTADFRKILTAIATQRPEEGDSEEERARRGHAILDKANPENVARITRGEEPIYEGEGKTYSKNDAISYIENNRGAKYYKIATGRGTVQKLTDAARAMEAVQDSPITQFELDTHGDTIQFSAPYDKKQGQAVRAMGGLD